VARVILDPHRPSLLKLKEGAKRTPKNEFMASFTMLSAMMLGFKTLADVRIVDIGQSHPELLSQIRGALGEAIRQAREKTNPPNQPAEKG
jgi:hypothetical protein